MAYIGKIPGGTALTSRTLDSMTGDGSDTTLTLSQTPDSVMDVAIFCDGVMQRPGIEYTLTGNTITFTTAPANGVFICALTGGSEDIASPMANSVTTDKLVDGVVTDSKVVSVASSKLSGALPALDGSALTGLPSPFASNSNDPAVNTNPSDGTGSIWINKTSGEVFICTDATAGANVWTNVGPGTDNIEPWVFPGTIRGFAAGNVSSNVIDSFSFASDGNAIDHGDLTVARTTQASSSSSTHGYTSSGSASHLSDRTIDKFTFASTGNATDVGDLTSTMTNSTGQSSETHGFTSGGDNGPQINIINKFSFSVDGNATDHGDMTTSRSNPTGQSSATHGYTSGGTSSNIIDKFSVNTNTTATDVGDLTQARSFAAGQSSETHGYTSAGYIAPNTNIIDKFAFASNNNATDVGDVTVARRAPGGQSSTTHGYITGGYTSVHSIVIDKFAFSSNNNATGVGDLTVARRGNAGTQY